MSESPRQRAMLLIRDWDEEAEDALVARISEALVNAERRGYMKGLADANAQAEQAPTNEEAIEVIVNGQRCMLVASPIRSLEWLANEALRITGNNEAALGRWELRTEEGYLLSLGTQIGAVVRQQLFLNPRAGIGA